MYKIIIISAFFIITNFAIAQEQRDFAYYNNETYELYMKANWEELIPLAKESLKNGHDSYYIRMRLGIAHYELKKYTQAIRQFKHALELFPESADAKSYMYYSYLFLGRRQEAFLYNTTPDRKFKYFQSMYFEPGIKLSDNKTSTRNTYYMFLGLNHELGNRISLFHGYQRLRSDFSYLTTISGGPGFGGGTIQWESIYKIVQNEYYAALTFFLGKGFYLTPAYHYQGVKGDEYLTYNNVGSIQLTKWAGKFKVHAGYYYSEINNLNQQQTELGLAFYPFGNNKLYLQTQATNHLQEDVSTMVYFNKIGVQVSPTTWLEASMSYGNMVNFSELNSYVVYNQLDNISSRWGVSIHQLLGKHMLYLNYVRENKEEYSTEIPFAHNDIIVGFNLTF